MKPLAAASRSVVQYFQGAYQEFKRVTWPTREAVIKYTILVLVTIIVSIAIITAFDYALQQLVSRYLV